MFKFLGAIASIVDKFVPTQNGRKRNELRKLEKELEQALINGTELDVARIRRRMSDIREEIRNTD